jgi:hypothetical protein
MRWRAFTTWGETVEIKKMQLLNIEQLEDVAGGWDPVTVTVTVVVAVISAGYLIGKDLAERDNADTCKVK